ncbi:Abscission/NoCut checkpoint regulator [Halotydeus destructor]|nr:Abscission/NoCut checkpoint regulator [Halotydeus destructor]
MADEDNSVDGLAKRLAKLRTPANIVEQRELEERLARLKGLDPANFSAPPIMVYQRPRIVTSDDLMKQLTAEAHLDTDRGMDGIKTRDETEDEVIERLLAEANLPDLSDVDVNHSKAETLAQSAKKRLKNITSANAKLSQTDDSDELPWCAICNEDAKLRCIDCDGDLYCHECFREFHCDSDTRTHATRPYRRKSLN